MEVLAADTTVEWWDGNPGTRIGIHIETGGVTPVMFPMSLDPPISNFVSGEKSCKG
jgi:hypothetical protein